MKINVTWYTGWHFHTPGKEDCRHWCSGWIIQFMLIQEDASQTEYNSGSVSMSDWEHREQSQWDIFPLLVCLSCLWSYRNSSERDASPAKHLYNIKWHATRKLKVNLSVTPTPPPSSADSFFTVKSRQPVHPVQIFSKDGKDIRLLFSAGCETNSSPLDNIVYLTLTLTLTWLEQRSRDMT